MIYLPILGLDIEFGIYICLMNTNKKIPFNHSYKSLSVWFICTYLVFGPLLSLLRSFSFSGIIAGSLNEYSIFSSIAKMNSLFCFFLFMYMSYMVFYWYYPKKKLSLSIGMILTLFIPIVVRFFVDQTLLFWIFGETNYLLDISFKSFFRDNTFFAVYYIPSGIIYYFYKRNEALQEAQLEAERLRSQAELTHLRSQVNPHFLFNSLNNIYSLAYEKSDKILGAIEGLSELLRYSLYEKAESVPFRKEWKKVQQLIKIEQMRLLSPTNFEMHIADDVLDINIPPVILLPLIENVFKHGEVQDHAIPPSINAYLIDDFLKIRIVNKISISLQKDKQHGIGLDNIKKRLFYAYGDAASIEVLEKEDTFTVQLSIPSK